MNILQEQLNSAMSTAETLSKENNDLKQQLATMSIALQNQKEKNMLEFAKHQDNMELQAAKLDLEAQKQNVQIDLDVMDKQSELAKDAMEIEMKKIDLSEKAMGLGE